MSVLVATSNAGKIREFRSLLGGKLLILSPQDKNFRDRQLPLVEENGDTYFENALKKALAYFHTFKVPVLSDDSGLEVEALGGRPGVRSSRFGGEISWRERWQKLFDAIGDSTEGNRRALFRCVLCYYDGKDVPHFFQGTVDGLINNAARGDHGFGYDPIFLYPPFQKTFAELDHSEKDGISHRASAVHHFLSWWDLDHMKP